MQQAERNQLVEEISHLAGNQARIALLWLIHSLLKHDELINLKHALEIAETYSPDSDLKSF